MRQARPREIITAWKVSEYPCFPVLEMNTGKYGPKKPAYLNTFHAVQYRVSHREESIKTKQENKQVVEDRIWKYSCRF